MKLVIVSGLSGSGKSIALHTLEDVGYYCIDNLPVSLIDALAGELGRASQPVELAAIGIDARNLPHELEHFDDIVSGLEKRGIRCEILFLKCRTDTLIQRFSETRRRHPLSSDKVPLADAIAREQQLLSPIAERASLVIDTSSTNVHELRELVMERVERRRHRSLSLLFESFGYKHGIPADADFVFDARCLPNPHWDPRLRPQTGRDRPVIDFLAGQPQVNDMYEQLRHFLETWIPAFERDNRSYLTVAIGCTGGQHRSVYLVEQLASHFHSSYPNIVVRHRELA